MSVDRVPIDRFLSDKRQGRESIKAQIELVIRYIDALKKIDSTGRMRTALFNFQNLTENDEDLTPPQVNYLEGIYEKTMAVISGSAKLRCPRHYDRKNGLRYPK
jgi:hypothetical protein